MKLFHRPFLACIAAFGLALAARAQTPNWDKTTPTEVAAAGIGVQLTGADYGNGTFVLATYFGGTNAVPAVTPAVFTSPDGITWTRRSLPAGGRTGAPRFLNGKFFLGLTPDSNFGGNGVILSSSDGIAWTASANLGSAVNAPNEFTYGNGIYAAPLSNSAVQVATSTDGLTWSTRPIVAGGASSHITFFNGKFYANIYNSAAGLYSSTDGVTWAKIAGAPTNPGILAASSSTLLVTFFSGNTSGQSVSTDGVAFTTASPGITLQTETVKFLNGAFVATASPSPSSFDLSLARASADGKTWATIGSTTNTSYATEVAYGNGRYVFVGEFDVFSGASTVSPGGSSGGGGGGTPAPTVSAQPVASQSAAIGSSITFTVTFTGTGLTYQWYFNGVAISGAVNFSYTIGSVTLANAGSYTVTATNAGGSITSNPAVLSVAAASNTARLSNVSIRAGAGSDSQTLIVGVTVGGSGTSGSKTLLVRGTGPALTAFNVPGALADPVINVYSGNAVIANNDDWTDPQVVAQGSALGAFALTPGAKDAALVGTIPSGGYTVQLTGKAGATGVGLVEVYDATTSFTTATPRLTNVSARTQVGTGGNILICGFVVAGSGNRQVLIRAAGPALTAFNVAGVLADPKLELYNGASVKIDENDNWVASTLAAQNSVGAFGFTASSKDSVIVATLAPGSYTAQVSGINSTTGVALVEIYELP